jgi:hypothetical protein
VILATGEDRKNEVAGRKIIFLFTRKPLMPNLHPRKGVMMRVAVPADTFAGPQAAIMCAGISIKFAAPI